MGQVGTTAEIQVPDVGARGGLGRTLLTAFLVLALLPLGGVSWYAIRQSRLNIQQEVSDRLASVAVFKETQVNQWVEERIAAIGSPDLCFDAGPLAQGTIRGREEAEAALAQAADRCGITSIALLDGTGRVEWEVEWEKEEPVPIPDPGSSAVVQVSLEDSQIMFVVPATYPAPWVYIAALVPVDGLVHIMKETPGLRQSGEVYMVDRDGNALPPARCSLSPVLMAALEGEEGQGLYENCKGIPVIGAYRWLPDLGLALFVEETQERAFAGNEAVAAAVVFATLVVALVTTSVAALVIGRIVRPVRLLTESALRIAQGDLSQRVEVSSRDEIGILANVFNRMSAELEVLYNDLEAQVAHRTQLLQQANYLNQRRAIQMQASLEVGQAVTSILDPDRLLERVVQVVRDRFVYSCVAVYTVNDDGGELICRAIAGRSDLCWGGQVPTERDDPTSRAFRENEPVVDERPVTVGGDTPVTYTRFTVALPLSLGDQTVGVLAVESTEEEGIDQDELSILRNVAQQVAIALENARAYRTEKEAVQRLRELEQSKRRFLMNMSHEFITPLTNILGFSRLMLRYDGPSLTEQQRCDLELIHRNGQHLLGLLKDLLDISQIEAGLMELELHQVDLAELIHSVAATANALVRGKPVIVREEIEAGLPPVWADPTRLRQVVLRLVENAAKFTDEGSISLRAWADGEAVYVSVSDTGVGIRPDDLERIFERFEQARLPNGHYPTGAGLGLALSKEFVEMHGGKIWVESKVGEGSVFTFTLPRRRQEAG